MKKRIKLPVNKWNRQLKKLWENGRKHSKYSKQGESNG